jgi:hypothetical protein
MMNQNVEEREDEEQDRELDLNAIAHSLTWEGYRSLDAEGRRRMIRQLWTLYDRRKPKSGS